LLSITSVLGNRRFWDGVKLCCLRVSAEEEQAMTACMKEVHLDSGIHCGSSKAKLLQEVKTYSLAEQLEAGTVAPVSCHRARREKDC